MTEPQRDYADELWNLMNELADSVLDATDEEILEETEDIEAAAEGTCAVLLEAVKAHQRRRLQDARTEYDQRVAALESTRADWQTASLDEKRSLLAAVFAAQPRLQAALTAQHREFRELSDADVESYLKQLAELDVMSDLAPEDE